ncbi:MAG: EAL domain-containing protein [Arenicellales bacterium]
MGTDTYVSGTADHFSVRKKSLFPWPAYLFITLVIAAIAVAADQAGWLKRLNNLFYDIVISADSRPPAGNIAIIAIDEKSIARLGRWPWSREIHTRLLRRLSKLDHPATGFDIIFSEPSANLQVDNELARAIRAHARVVLPVVPTTGYESGSVRELHPIALLEESVAGLGSVDAELDEDGICRSLYLLSGLGAATWPSFPLAMLSLNMPDIEDRLPGETNPELGGSTPGKWVRDKRVFIPFAGPPGHYPTISYVDVLEGKTKLDDLAGKYLLVGVTAAGIGDRLPTPTTGNDYQMSGVETMANVLDAISNDLLITSVNKQYQTYFTFLAVMIPLLLYPLLGVRLSLIMWASASLCILIFSALLLQSQYWLPPATAFIFTIIAFPIWAWSRLKVSSQMLTEVDEKRSAEMDAVDHGLIILDMNLRIEHMNELAEKMVNSRLRDVVNLPLDTVIPEFDVETGINGAAGENNEAVPIPKVDELIINDYTGNPNKVYIHSNPFSDRWGNSRGHVINLSLDPASLSNRAGNNAEQHHDELTGLFDRTSISHWINQEIKKASEPGDLYVLNIDIDNLTLITSSRNHQFSDQVTVKYVHRLQGICSDDDTLGRLGSDQLVLLLKNGDINYVKKIAAEIIDQAKHPIIQGTEQIILAVNIGISHYPTDGDDAETLLKHASFAIRQNESTARTGYKFYSRNDHELSMLDHNLEQNLRQSINNNTLELYFQPQIDLKSGEVIGFESLLRWKDKNNLFVSTDKAIKLAEQSELIHQLGRWVVHAACEQIQQWQQSSIPIRRFSINLSPADLEQQDFLEYATHEIQSHAIDPSVLELEITEHSVLKNTDLSMHVLNAFNDMGTRLAIDDFGTGYSTFNYLKSLPVKTVKIDKSFVQNMVEIKDDAFITLSIISMAHGLGINVVAEGIEMESQLKMLTRQGCDIAQGYLISRPMPAAEVKKWLNEKCQKRNGMYHFKGFSKWI